MPTDTQRTGYRLGLGAATVFVLGMAIGWPLSTICAVFTAIFLQSKTPLPLGAGLSLMVLGFGLMAAAFLVFSILNPYPVPFIVAVTVAVALSFLWAVRGGGMLPVVLALMAALMVPFLVRSSNELAATLVFWIPVNIGIAAFFVQFWFMVLPAETTDQEADQAAPEAVPFDEARRLVRMTLVTVPFASAFFLFEAGAVLTLLFIAILTQQLAASTGSGPQVAGGMLIANVVGGVASIIAYELVVVAPFFPFMALVAFAICLAMGRWFASGTPMAPLAGSALTTALILFGGTMSPFGDEADAKMLARLFQVGMALAYVLLAFLVMDAILPERERDPGKREAA